MNEPRADNTTRGAKKRATSVGAEAVAGVTTFFTMAYIVAVNPLILSGRASKNMDDWHDRFEWRRTTDSLPGRS